MASPEREKPSPCRVPCRWSRRTAGTRHSAARRGSATGSIICLWRPGRQRGATCGKLKLTRCRGEAHTFAAASVVSAVRLVVCAFAGRRAPISPATANALGEAGAHRPLENNADELPHRKLQTLIGEEPREKARDIYDAGWLVTERPELIREDDREKLERWLAAKSPADIELLKERVRDDAITGRADAENIWKLLAEGIGRLKEYDRSGGPRADRIPGDAGGGGGRGPTRWAMAKHDSPMRLAEEQDDATPDRAPRAKLPRRSERKGPYRE